MINPLISVIVPCYNQAQYLDECLQSIYNQTYTNWECIIVNDGSPDNSDEVGKRWAEKDSRFKYYYKENEGVSSARNYGLGKAAGEFIQFLDSDDLLNSEKIELSLLEVSKDSEQKIGLVVSNFQMFEECTTNMIKPYCVLSSDLMNLDSVLFFWNNSFTIPIHCGFFQASLFSKIRFQEGLDAQEDWIMWVSVFNLVNKVIFIDKPLALYRHNPSSRMNTIGIGEEQIKAVKYLIQFLPEAETRKFALSQLDIYYKSNSVNLEKLKASKKTYVYQTGLLIKKSLRIVGLLKVSRKIFPLLLRLKA